MTNKLIGGNCRHRDLGGWTPERERSSTDFVVPSGLGSSASAVVAKIEYNKLLPLRERMRNYTTSSKAVILGRSRSCAVITGAVDYLLRRHSSEVHTNEVPMLGQAHKEHNPQWGLGQQVQQHRPMAGSRVPIWVLMIIGNPLTSGEACSEEAHCRRAFRLGGA